MEEDVDKGKENKIGFLKNKWAKITVLGMGGLLAIIWFVSIWVRP
jgi:hypothetical protein